MERGSARWKWKYWGGVVWEDKEGRVVGDTSVGKEQRGEEEEDEVMFGKGLVLRMDSFKCSGVWLVERISISPALSLSLL